MEGRVERRLRQTQAAGTRAAVWKGERKVCGTVLGQRACSWCRPRARGGGAPRRDGDNDISTTRDRGALPLGSLEPEKVTQRSLEMLRPIVAVLRERGGVVGGGRGGEVCDRSELASGVVPCNLCGSLDVATRR